VDPNRIDAEYVVHAALGVGLELAPAHVPGVVLYFKMIAGMAESVNAFPLDDIAEQAAIFTPCSTSAPD
jgi:hypothetical protein